MGMRQIRSEYMNKLTLEGVLETSSQFSLPITRSGRGVTGNKPPSSLFQSLGVEEGYWEQVPSSLFQSLGVEEGYWEQVPVLSSITREWKRGTGNQVPSSLFQSLGVEEGYWEQVSQFSLPITRSGRGVLGTSSQFSLPNHSEWKRGTGKQVPSSLFQSLGVEEG
ncbi:hypothetical protein OS493_026746 [Desmophyllum pertusum]|uniref:Uncharacterized protein n=1 Tax=Desmophyllum pertusum TaxID=174260 RepID=A0A9X0A248_9CNID|nr:hypothetical protein OS493_026746 [Desmophyllum pertusum]